MCILLKVIYIQIILSAFCTLLLIFSVGEKRVHWISISIFSGVYKNIFSQSVPLTHVGLIILTLKVLN